jgi:3-isopropylmalate/(R)-2-methylmalate dehydratase small subunit
VSTPSGHGEASGDAVPDIVRESRVWVFGDYINTDLIFPNVAMRLPREEQAQLIFSANRPGWSSEVEPGDLLVAGKDFGMGSGRHIGALFTDLGLQGVVAESINGLGFRNCIVGGFPALKCPGVTGLFSEGDRGRFNYSTGRIDNLTTGASLTAAPLPPLLLGIVSAGGVLQTLIDEDLIEYGKNGASA